jgi:hypothetical protein
MLQVLSTVISVLASVVPAVWFLSSRIQGLSGEFKAQSARVEEKINGLEKMMDMQQSMLKEAMSEQDTLRERLAVAEVQLSDVRKQISQ